MHLSHPTVRCATTRTSATLNTMTSVDLTPAQAPRSPARQTANKALRVTGRLRKALDLMVWDGLTDNQAAVSAGMNVLSIRLALRKQHVRAYFQQQTQVLREREGPRTIHAFIEVRDQKSNQMARVAAGKALLQLEDQPQNAAARHQSPGFVIAIVAAPAGSSASVEQSVRNADKPTISMDGTPLVGESRDADD